MSARMPVLGARNTGRVSVTPICPRSAVAFASLRARTSRGLRAASASIGEALERLRESQSLALIPPRSGSTSRSTTSRPRCRPIASLTDGSSPVLARCGSTLPIAARTIPRALMIPDRRIPPRSLGTPRTRPFGNARSLPREYTYAEPVAGATRSSPNPSDSASSTAPGTRARKASGPVSTPMPATVAPEIFPPMAADDSITSTRSSGRIRERKCAVARPAMPPPTISTSTS